MAAISDFMILSKEHITSKLLFQTQKKTCTHVEDVYIRVLHGLGLGPWAGPARSRAGPRNFLSTFVPGSGRFQVTNLMGYS